MSIRGGHFIRQLIGPLGLPDRVSKLVIEAEANGATRIYVTLIPADAAGLGVAVAGAVGGVEVTTVTDVVVNDKGAVVVKHTGRPGGDDVHPLVLGGEG